MPRYVGQKIFSRCADTNGDGTGTTDAVGDYSVTEDIFFMQPPANETFAVARVIVGMEDVGAFDSGSYGNNITLTNGIIVRVSDDSGVLNTLTAFPVKTNGEWAMMCHDFTEHNFGQGNVVGSVRWSFDKCGVPLTLRGNLNERVEIVLNDDFTGLVKHRFVLQGYEVSGAERDSSSRRGE